MGNIESLERPARRIGKWLLITVSLLAVLPAAVFTSCQSSLLYFPRSYPPGVPQAWAANTHGRFLDFSTSQGRQRAFLQGNLTHPAHLWLVCGGNGTVALEWSPWLLAHASQDDAWLLLDFPGYGACEGTATPGRIRETIATAVPLATAQLGWSLPRDEAKLRFFGHSLGAAACLIGAADFHIQRGVLMSPFTSTMAMAREVTGLPLGFLVRHRFDNSARLAELAAHGPGRVILLHGSQDEVIPAAMSRTLAASYPTLITHREIPGGHHNDLQELAAQTLTSALRDASK
jgi:pimeloyl-ACP methyl ester carboxylesterase